MRGVALRLLLITAIFAAASSTKAAPIEITVSLQPGTTDWYLDLNTLLPVTAIALVVPDAFESFTSFLPPPPIGCGGGDCGPLHPLDGDFQLFALDDEVPPGGLLGTGLLGRFSSQVTSGVQVLPADDLYGGTVFGPQFDPYDATLFSIHVVPEPSVSGLLLLTLVGATLRLTRP